MQMHHYAADAYAFAEVIKAWACAMRKVELPSFVSHLNRNARLARALRQSEARSGAEGLNFEDLLGRHPELSTIAPKEATGPAIPNCVSSLLRIPMTVIEAWKARADLMASVTPDTIAGALLWCWITQVRKLRDPDLGVKMARLPTLVNGRKALHPDLNISDDPYLGNLTLFSIAEMPVVELCDGFREDEPWLFAQACHRIADAQSDICIHAKHIGEVATLLEQTPSVFAGWTPGDSDSLHFTNWAHMDMYENNFGMRLGTPKFIRPPYTKADGTVIILPRGTGEEQAVEVVLMLREADLVELKKNFPGQFVGD